MADLIKIMKMEGNEYREFHYCRTRGRVHTASNMTEREIEKEYSRLRDLIRIQACFVK